MQKDRTPTLKPKATTKISKKSIQKQIRQTFYPQISQGKKRGKEIHLIILEKIKKRGFSKAQTKPDLHAAKPLLKSVWVRRPLGLG